MTGFENTSEDKPFGGADPLEVARSVVEGGIEIEGRKWIGLESGPGPNQRNCLVRDFYRIYYELENEPDYLPIRIQLNDGAAVLDTLSKEIFRRYFGMDDINEKGIFCLDFNTGFAMFIVLGKYSEEESSEPFSIFVPMLAGKIYFGGVEGGENGYNFVPEIRIVIGDDGEYSIERDISG